MKDRALKIDINTMVGSSEGTEDCYRVCMFLTDTLHYLGVDYMINVDENIITCLLHKDDVNEFELFSTMEEILSNDHVVESFSMQFVGTETI